MTTIVLDGCRAEPLGSYLKALGVLRLVGAQLDPGARGAWLGDRFVLQLDGDADRLLAFLADEYRPTPLLSPWNGGSGFGAKDKASAHTVATMASTDDPRFAGYRSAIEVVRGLVAAPDWAAAAKEEQVRRCRNAYPDDALAWIDATIVLTGDDRLGRTFAPLFGTGGNDGRLEFSANFMANVLAATGVTRLGRGIDRHRLLRSSLLGEDAGALVHDASSGPYDPGAGGGVNSAPTGDAGSLLNPWDFVLLFEGGLLFASGAARRFGTETGAKAAVPFCVDVSRTGGGVLADGEDVRAEVWAPLWRRPATAREIARVIGEGRAEWGRGTARTGVDFARAVASLAVDRGIDSFVRHGLAQRFGLSYLAVGLDRVQVGGRPEVRVTEQVDGWVAFISSKNRPAALDDALHRLERALYRAAAGDGNVAVALQEVLACLADVEDTIARASDREERRRQPVVGLDARDWLPVLDDRSPELRLAAALASARSVGGAPSALALLLRPIELEGRSLRWSPGSPIVDDLGRRPVFDVLADALARRAIDLAVTDDDPDDDPGQKGLRLGAPRGVRASLDDVAALVEGTIDEARLERVLRGLLLLDWRGYGPGGLASPQARGRRAVPPALAAVGPFLTRERVQRPDRDGVVVVDVRLTAAPTWPALLRAGRVDDVAADALRRLAIAGLDPAPVRLRSPSAYGPRLAAVAFCQLAAPSVHALLDQTCPPEPMSEEDR